MRHIKDKILDKISKLVIRYPKVIFGASAALALFSIVYSALFLSFDTNQDNLVSMKEAYQQRYIKFITEFGDRENIYVIFESEDKKYAKTALLRLVEKLKTKNELYADYIYREDPSFFRQRAFLLLPEPSFENLSQRFDQWNDELNQIFKISNYQELFRFINQRFNFQNQNLEENKKDLEFAFNFLEKIIDGLDEAEKISQLSKEELFQPLIGTNYYQDPDGFFFSRNGKLLFLAIEPKKDYSKTNLIKDPLSFLRIKLEELKQEFPELEVGITGKPVLQDDEMASTRADSVWVALVALIGITLLFIYYFKSAKRPVLAIVSLLFSMAWTIGLTTATIGHLNLLTIVFGIILLGLGIDYGIHYLFRYQKERQNHSLEDAISISIQKTGGAIFTAAISSSVAFLSALFTDFLGLQELGFVAGSGLLLCLISQIITLPSGLLLFDKKISNKEKLKVPTFYYLDGILRKPRLYLFLIIIFSLIVAIPSLNVQFEHNLLNLQDPNLESVKYEKKIIENSDRSTWFAAFISPNKEKLKTFSKKLEKIDSVGSVESIWNFLPENQGYRIQKLQKISSSLKEDPKKEKNTKLDGLESELKLLKNKLEKLQDMSLRASKTEAVEKLDKLLSQIDKPLALLEQSKKTEIIKSERAFMDFLNDSKDSLRQALEPSPIKESEIPPKIKSIFKGDKGNYVLYTYPADNIWEPDFMNQFISDIRRIDPYVTGTPIQVYESAKRMREGFVLVGLITILVVFLILKNDLKKLKDAAFASIPLFVGIFWLTGFMGLFDIKLSLANFFAMPVLIGIGIDNGVHLIHRYRETNSVSEMLHSTSPAIILSAFTTILGFGALSFVRHPGLASFGQIMAIGSLTCLMASLFLVPLILKICYKNPKEIN